MNELSPIEKAYYKNSAHNDDQEADAISLFTGKIQGHMEVWEYGSSFYPGDPAGGSEYWAALVEKPGAYYPVQGEIQTIKNAIRQQNLIKCLSDVQTVIELGPGSSDSVIQKTYPFLKSCPSLRSYIAVDATRAQAQNAEFLVKKELSLQTGHIEANYMTSPLHKAWHGKSAVIMWGISIGNISAFAGEDAFPKLVSALTTLKTPLKHGDILIFSFDTEMRKDKIIRAYSESYLRSSVLSSLYRMKRDGIVTGHFNPRIWCHEPLWFSKVGQCAHAVYPLFDQQINIAGMTIKIPAWRRFISNNSYKFSSEMVEKAAKHAGIQPLFCLQNGPMAMFVGKV